ncbi:HAD hydrolase family protein [bacterium]|nr:HAD hydrolase family protein [bacterium]
MSGRWPLPDAETARCEVIEKVGDGLCRRLARIELCVFDCDGILTPANLFYGADGEALKEFNARDGLGLMMLRAARVARAVLTGRTSAMVERRCRDLRFEAIQMGRFDKIEALEEIWRATGTTADVTLYMGDDLLDLPALAAAALAITVPGAPDEVQDVCDWTTGATGGEGAVREVCDLVLKARGAHADAIRALAAGGKPADDPEVTH